MAAPIHPAVAPVVQELRRDSPDRYGFVSFKYISTDPTEIERIGRFLSLLLYHLEPYGFELDYSNHFVGMRLGGSILSLDIATPRKRLIVKGPFGDFPEYEHVGRMVLRIGGSAKGTRRKWADMDTCRVEDAVDEIVESVRVNMILRKEHDEVERQREERLAHLTHRRELAALRAKREEDRLEFLNWIAIARRETDTLRATIAAVPQSCSMPEDYWRMIKWAENRLANLEAETTVERIQERLIEQQLYTNPDYLFDSEGEPPAK